MPKRRLDSDQRLSLILETQREIAAVDDELDRVMQLVADRSRAITGADGAMVNLVEGHLLHTRAVSGVAEGVAGVRRPIGGSVARFAIASRQPVLVEDTLSDPRINQELRAKIGDRSLICVPLMRGSAVIGTLNVMSCSEEERLDEQDRETLEMLSVVLSAAVSQAAEQEARRAERRAIARFRTLFEGASIGIAELDREGTVVGANPALEHMLGLGGELKGTRLLARVLDEDRPALQEGLARLTAEGRESFGLEVRCHGKGARPTWLLLRAVAERTSGQEVAVVVMVEDVTQRKQTEQELIQQSELNQHQALHDPLTGLPNRLLFTERVGQAVARGRRNGTHFAVALMDLNHFKEVNDSLGHPAGDELLVRVGERVDSVVRGVDTVARLGGDEFGLLLTDLSGPGEVVPILERIRSVLERPIQVQSLPLAVEASIGVALFPGHGKEPHQLIQRADMAMYESKRNSTGFVFYDESFDQRDVGRLTLTAELRRAISNGELVLHYQPKAALDNGEVRSVEALVRWQHPRRGLIYPDAFIPVAQETSLIAPLTLYVLEEALRQGQRWREEGLELSVSVNISTRTLLDRDFPRQVRELLEHWELGPGALELEVTESAMLANPARAQLVLTELSEMGLRLSIDDFGTGYSSLAYLRQLPVDEIKIDRSFVLGMQAQADDAVIVRSTVDLGRNLGLEVVAEGVETAELWERLRELGCNTAQGYYLSRPVPADELSAWLHAWPAAGEGRQAA